MLKILTAKNATAELKKLEAINKQLFALQQKKQKARRERWETMLLRALRDVQYIGTWLIKESQQRSKKISDETKAGLERARARGVKLGGARRKTTVDIKKLQALRKKGLTQQEIASRLGISQALVSLRLRGAKK